MQTSNKGQTGLKSIRLSGMRIDDLPIAEHAYARAQLPLVEDTERQNKIENILAGSPKQSVSYIKARIEEARQNIQRVADLKTRELQTISEYTGAITLCKHRDDLLSEAKTDDEVKDIHHRFPLYNVKKMEEQIEMCKASIQRAEDVIGKEHDSIEELTSVLAQCEVRDSRLRALGVKVG